MLVFDIFLLCNNIFQQKVHASSSNQGWSMLTCILKNFMLLTLCIFLHSVYQATFALHEIKYSLLQVSNSYMFQHCGAILREWKSNTLFMLDLHLLVEIWILCHSYCVCSYNQHIIRHIHSVIHHLWHISTRTCFGTDVPTSVSHYNKGIYRGADKSLACPPSGCILFDGENISFDARLVIYVNSNNIPPIMIINIYRIWKSKSSVAVAFFLPGWAKELSAPL